MRVRPDRSISRWTTNSTRSKPDWPIAMNRSGSSRSGASRAFGSDSAVRASSNKTPCLRTFVAAFSSSYSKLPWTTVAMGEQCRKRPESPHGFQDVPDERVALEEEAGARSCMRPCARRIGRRAPPGDARAFADRGVLGGVGSCMAASTDRTPPDPTAPNDAAVEAAFQAVPATRVAEILDGALHTRPRPARDHTNTASVLGGELHGPFRRGNGGPGGWVILDEPELHLGPKPDKIVPDLAGWRRARMPDALGPSDAPAHYDVAHRGHRPGYEDGALPARGRGARGALQPGHADARGAPAGDGAVRGCARGRMSRLQFLGKKIVHSGRWRVRKARWRLRSGRWAMRSGT